MKPGSVVLSQPESHPVKTTYEDPESTAHMEALRRGILVAIDKVRNTRIDIVEIVGEAGIVEVSPGYASMW
jgi:hypothetical protein